MLVGLLGTTDRVERITSIVVQTLSWWIATREEIHPCFAASNVTILLLVGTDYGIISLLRTLIGVQRTEKELLSLLILVALRHIYINLKLIQIVAISIFMISCSFGVHFSQVSGDQAILVLLRLLLLRLSGERNELIRGCHSVREIGGALQIAWPCMDQTIRLLTVAPKSRLVCPDLFFRLPEGVLRSHEDLLLIIESPFFRLILLREVSIVF